MAGYITSTFHDVATAVASIEEMEYRDAYSAVEESARKIGRAEGVALDPDNIHEDHAVALVESVMARNTKV